LFVEGEEMFEGLALGVDAVAAVAGVYRPVEPLVGAPEGRRHGVGVVEVGERSLPVRGSVG